MVYPIGEMTGKWKPWKEPSKPRGRPLSKLNAESTHSPWDIDLAHLRRCLGRVRVILEDPTNQKLVRQIDTAVMLELSIHLERIIAIITTLKAV